MRKQSGKHEQRLSLHRLKLLLLPHSSSPCCSLVVVVAVVVVMREPLLLFAPLASVGVVAVARAFALQSILKHSLGWLSRMSQVKEFWKPKSNNFITRSQL